MTDGVWGGPIPTCPSGGEHEFTVELGSAGSVAGLTIHCPDCAGSSPPTPIGELAEMLAARHRTLAGILALPDSVRVGLVASGVLVQLCVEAMIDVEQAVACCRAQVVTEPPAIWTADPADVEQVMAGLVAVGRWLTEAPRVIRIPRQRTG